jgi:hypothetical protein
MGDSAEILGRPTGAWKMQLNVVEHVHQCTTYPENIRTCNDDLVGGIIPKWHSLSIFELFSGW